MDTNLILEKIFRLEDAEILYNTFGIITLFKNGKLEFEEEKNKCDICGEYKADVEYTIDPYIEEIYGESIYKNMCDECYQNAIYDI